MNDVHSNGVAPSRTNSPGSSQRYSRKASIVLIGMRGVGKTTLATIAGRALGWETIDTDSVFERNEQKSIADYIGQHGWDAFRKVESEILHSILDAHPTERVIACGGGVVELEENRNILKAFREQGIVVHILREKDAVLKYLRESTHFPPYIHETSAEAWSRREVYFRQVCSFEFVSLTVPIPPAPEGTIDSVTPDQTLALKPVERDFFRLLRFIHGVDTNKVPLPPRLPRSYSLSLTFRDVREAIPILDDISVGIDVWEFRVDLLESYDPTFIAYQVALLRQYSSLPIVLTIRTAGQGGRYPDPTDPASSHRLELLLYHALRLGVEYLDLELTLPRQLFIDLVAYKGNTSVIGSYHSWRGNLPWTGAEMRHIYDSIVHLGADVVKIVNIATTFQDNMALRQFAKSVERNPKPLLAINMGNEGKISQALNSVLSPVTHPLLPHLAAPGQLSFAESMSILYLTGLITPKKFYLFGHPIQHSMSPIMQNTAFATLGLPHTYELRETQKVDEIVEVLRSPSFGGASVTIPFKIDIIPMLQHISRQARIIGAVNTIIPVPEGLSGDNTDWRALKTCLLRSITPANGVTSTTTTLVLGAGGTTRATIYALYHIGVVNIVLFNRTKAKAQLLADEFNKLDPLLRIRVIDSLAVPLPIHPSPTMIISTVPGIPEGARVIKNGDAASGAQQGIDLGLTLDHFSPAGGVAIEWAYDPPVTKLISLARQKKDHGWITVEGIDLLLEQGYEQFQLWTGRRAPMAAVRRKVYESYASGVR